jgi:ADP-heptose:LPS heptosyltransferase
MIKKKNLKKALFINFGGIGDELLFFPTLKDFKEVYPDCKTTLLLEPRSASAAKLTNTIDEVITFDVKNLSQHKAFLGLVKIILQGRYNAVISSGSNKFICLMLFLSMVKTRVGYNTGWLSRKLLSTVVDLNKYQYAANMYHDLLKGVGIDKETPLPEVIVSEQAMFKAEQILGVKDKPILVIHPGVSKLSIKKNIIKSWPEENWVKLIRALLETNKYKVALAGGPDDEETIIKIQEELEQRNTDKTDFVNLCGKTGNLEELTAVIKLSDMLICVDSAPMHIGIGVNTKVIAIFGPTDENKLLPKNKDFVAVHKLDLTCRPCLWDKRNEVCDEPLCLNISVEFLLGAINALQMT